MSRRQRQLIALAGIIIVLVAAILIGKQVFHHTIPASDYCTPTDGAPACLDE